METRPDIIEIMPSPEEVEIVRALSAQAAEYAVVWRVFTASEREKKAVFRKGETITFTIDCSVAKIIAQLGAPFMLEMISFSVRSQQSQPLYSFKMEDKIPFANFRIQLQIKAVLSGVFELKTLFFIENTEYFHVNSGEYFRIM